MPATAMVPPTLLGPIFEGAQVLFVAHTRAADWTSIWVDGEVAVRAPSAAGWTEVALLGPRLRPGSQIQAASEYSGSFAVFSEPLEVLRLPERLRAPWFLDDAVDQGAARVLVRGGVPGHAVVVRAARSGREQGRAFADPNGEVAVPLNRTLSPEEPLLAVVEVAAPTGPEAGPASDAIPVEVDDRPPGAAVWLPLWPQGLGIELTGLLVGSYLRVTDEAGAILLETQVHRPIQTFWWSHRVEAGRRLSATSSFTSDFRERVATPAQATVPALLGAAAGSPAGVPGPGFSPFIPRKPAPNPPQFAPLVDGQAWVVVTGLVVGASWFWVQVIPGPVGTPLEDLGLDQGPSDRSVGGVQTSPRPVGGSDRVAVPWGGVRHGEYWALVQEVAGVRAGTWRFVGPGAALSAPVLSAGLTACRASVTVRAVVPGSVVRVWFGRRLLAWAVAGGEEVDVPMVPVTRTGQRLSATQELGGRVSARSDEVEVQAPPAVLLAPVVKGPVEPGARSLWLTRLVPGSLVDVWWQLEEDPPAAFALGYVAPSGLGKVELVGPLPSGGRVYAAASRCGPALAGEPEFLTPFSLEQAGSWPVVVHDRCLGDLGVTFDGLPARVRTWMPVDREPFGVMYLQHGIGVGVDFKDIYDLEYTPDPCSKGENLSSKNIDYLGYAWLASYLASHGLAVASVGIENTGLPDDYAEVFLAAVQALRRSPEGVLPANVANLPTLFAGHSLGGQAVTLAAHDAPSDLNLRGLVAFVPTTYTEELSRPPVGLPYLQLFGLEDFFVDKQVTRTVARLRGVPAWDREQRPRTLIAIAGVGHGNFNEQWYLSGEPKSRLPPSRTQEELFAAVRPFVGAFAMEHLLGWSFWRGYLEGIVRPSAADRFDMRVLHEKVGIVRPWYPVVVVDAFGNASPGIDHESTPGEPETNDLGLPNRFENYDPELLREYVVPDLELRNSGDPGSALLHDEGVRFMNLPTRGGGEATFELGDLGLPESYTLHAVLASGRHQPPAEPGYGAKKGLEESVDADFLPPDGVAHPLRVALVDTSGNAASVNTLALDGLPRETLFGEAPVATFVSVRIPLSAFLGENPRLDLSHLAQVKLVSAGPSYLALRTLEFEP